MDVKLLMTVFSTVFVAEMGDKTQLSTMLFSANSAHARLTVFVAASAALVLTSALGVLAGGILGKFISPRVLNILAGIGFILVGVWTLVKR
jgi:putative Ca2+/H+ antiporter (TMEM165/GDT1 family)